MGVTSNTLARRIATKTLFADMKPFVDSSLTCEQGDLLMFDTGTQLIKKLAAETDGEFICGIAPVKITAGKLAHAYTTDVDASVATPALPGPEYGSIYKVILKAGDSLVAGANVFADPVTGGRNVQAAGTKEIGKYQGAAVTAPAGGLEIEVLIGCRAPNDILKF